MVVTWMDRGHVRVIPHTDTECIRCGQQPTPEGHDACLGTILGVRSACCGHGKELPFVILTWRFRITAWVLLALAVLIFGS